MTDLPHCITSEQILLGHLMRSDEARDSLLESLHDADFYYDRHRALFRNIKELFDLGAPCDLPALVEQLTVTGQFEALGGHTYVSILTKIAEGASDYSQHWRDVIYYSRRRQLIYECTALCELARYPGVHSMDDLLDSALKKIRIIDDYGLVGRELISIKGLLPEAIEHIDTLYQKRLPITGIPTGFTDFDEFTSGLQPSELIIIAGRPSMGRATFAMNIAEHVATKEERPVVVFSMDIASVDLVTRMLSSLGRIDHLKLRTGNLADEDWPRLTSAISTLNEALLTIDDTPELTASEIRARAKRLVREHGKLGLIVIDNLHLIYPAGIEVGRPSASSDIPRTLKSLAKELDVPVVALASLRSDLEHRTDKRPMLSDLRDSESIEQSADLIVFIYRDEVYYEDSPDKGMAEIIIARRRNGPIGSIMMPFVGRHLRFGDLDGGVNPGIAEP